MEERKLTKADIDKVRHIEGFPMGRWHQGRARRKDGLPHHHRRHPAWRACAANDRVCRAV